MLRIISAKKSITFAAAEEILVTAGGSYFKINGAGIEHGTTGNYTIYAAQHPFTGPNSLDMSLPNAPKNYDVQFVFKDDDGQPYKNHHYYVWTDSGQSYEGVTDDEGKTQVFHSPTSEEYQARLIMKRDQQHG